MEPLVRRQSLKTLEMVTPTAFISVRSSLILSLINYLIPPLKITSNEEMRNGNMKLIIAMYEYVCSLVVSMYPWIRTMSFWNCTLTVSYIWILLDCFPSSFFCLIKKVKKSKHNLRVIIYSRLSLCCFPCLTCHLSCCCCCCCCCWWCFWRMKCLMMDGCSG